MDKLTWYDEDGRLYCRRGYEVALARLASYEATGLTPEEIKELLHDTTGPLHHKLGEWIDADASGRLVVLPCKVGDTVWLVGAVRKLYSAKVRTFFCGNVSAVRGGDDDGHIQMIRTTECDIPIKTFGKTVFLTREEAEKALAEMEGKKDGNETSM